jgi:hypothetical protein
MFFFNPLTEKSNGKLFLPDRARLHTAVAGCMKPILCYYIHFAQYSIIIYGG